MLTLDDFAGSIGKDFELTLDGGALQLRLAEAQAVPHGLREGGAFRLLFVGPRQPILPQAIYPLREGGREHEIFLVPIASDEGGTQYEAIFN